MIPPIECTPGHHYPPGHTDQCVADSHAVPAMDPGSIAAMGVILIAVGLIRLWRRD